MLAAGMVVGRSDEGALGGINSGAAVVRMCVNEAYVQRSQKISGKGKLA